METDLSLVSYHSDISSGLFANKTSVQLTLYKCTTEHGHLVSASRN